MTTLLPTTPRARLVRRLESVGSADAALFDVPGPRARRRIAIATVISLLLMAAAVGYAGHQFAAHGQLAADKWKLFTEWPVIRYLLHGLRATVVVTLVSGAIAVPLGALLALGRLARNAPLRLASSLYVEVLRAVPLLLLVYACLLGLPTTGIRIPLFWQLVIPIVLCNSAVLAEIFRSGVRALPAGQSEAAHALGLSYGQGLRLVILPQAVRITLPALVSQVIRLLKDSTLGYVVSYLELLNSAKVLGEFNHTVVQAYLVVALIFVLVNTALAGVARRLESH